MVVLHDLTERKEHEEELTQARAQLMDAIESLDSGLVMYDATSGSLSATNDIARFTPSVPSS